MTNWSKMQRGMYASGDWTVMRDPATIPAHRRRGSTTPIRNGRWLIHFRGELVDFAPTLRAAKARVDSGASKTFMDAGAV